MLQKKNSQQYKKKQNIIVKQKKLRKLYVTIYNIIILYIKYELESSKTFQEFISRYNWIYDAIQNCFYKYNVIKNIFSNL